ncbi:MAG TPA: hypothetical protein V6D20_18840 [Candidatus Obscuribacterales bacterium]
MASTLVIWILRGVGLLTFLPGIILSLLLLLSIGTGVLWALQAIRRF